MEGYVAIASTGVEDSSIAPKTRAAIVRRPEMSLVVDEGGLLVATTGGLRCSSLPRGRGLILGPVLFRATSDHVDFAAGTTLRNWQKINPAELTEKYWGNYVAVLRDRAGGTDVIRAPFGQLPCLYARQGDMLLFASDIELLELAGWVSTGLDWGAIAHRVSYQNVPSSATCLSGVSELRGGSRLGIFDGRIDVAQTWTPWDHAGRQHWAGNRDEATYAVRRAVTTAVRASVSETDRALLMLSGGLDSSVLAASLAGEGGAYGCLNLSSRGGVGDERRYARSVANHLGAPILEAEWDVGLVDVTRSHAAGLPNPVARSFMQGTNALLADAIAKSGADLSIDGGAGDNVFCALQSVAPVTDAIVRGKSPREAWAVALCIASLAQVGAPTVLAHAIRRAFRGSPAYRWHGDTQYLASALFSVSAIGPGHPWLLAPKGSETGTAAHIALIVAAQSWAEASDLRSPVRHASPLASQPVIEACLRVPSWWWYDNGRNRVIAREAYADRLPAEIVKRRSKGSPDSYIAELYAANRVTIRAMLLNGRLRAAGMLDVPMLERALDEGGLVRGTDYHRIMRLADVEAWIAGRS